jgi:prepilin-type N-terminal cleavage/methylation domain-containing protein
MRSPTPIAARARDAARSHEQGFTLIEVMIALVLLLVAMTGVALAQLQALRSTSTSAARSHALHLAEEMLEEFQAMSFNDPRLGQGGVVQDVNRNPIRVDLNGNGNIDVNERDVTEYYRCWEVRANVPAAGLTTITVEVRAGDPGCNPTAAGLTRLPSARITGIKG